MKLSYNWLKDYINIKISPKQLEDKLTFSGIEVEAIVNLGENLKDIKVGKIIEKKQHPNADKLSICIVDDGKEKLQVICGAPNCAVDKKIAFAPIGTKFGEFVIKKVKLRGEESFGMICSEKELGISNDHDGILILPEDAPTGKDLSSYMEQNDTIYEVEITPNRPDLLGMIGVARDVSALLSIPLKIPDIKINESSEEISGKLELQNEAPDLCPRYTARMIKGVTIKESPEWLKKRLTSIGLRPINNVVDVTNFVMMEFGHPLHAFDYAKIAGKKIIVRKAINGEKFPALDEETYELKNTELVIADTEKPIAIAGVIGGENSHITESTIDIVIEAANFLYSSIRKTSNRLKISTDSSYRFERDIADETADVVSKRAAQLILEIAGGTLLKGKLDSFPDPKTSLIVKIRKSRVKRILSIDVSSDIIKKYLEALELKFIEEKNEVLSFEIPPFRKDLSREIDLIEEIIRLYGYDHVPMSQKPQQIMNRTLFFARRKLKDILVNNGFCEVKNWSFGDPEDLDKLGIPANDERRNFALLKNPLGNRFSIMRSMLIPDILNNALFNINHGSKNIKIFELIKVYTRKDQKLATERFHLSGLLTGNCNPVHWSEELHQIDFFDVKGIIEELILSLGGFTAKFKNSNEPFYQPCINADVIFKNEVIGSFGKIDPKIATGFGIKQPLYLFDIYLYKIFSLSEIPVPLFKEIPKYPPVLRDLSFLISKKIKFSSIIETIKNVDNTISKVDLFDEYVGENIEKHIRSLTFSIVFSSAIKTLTDEYINNIFKNVVAELKDKYNIEMR
ncbi:MAG: phenylalanine--tRNA ligase subunit beta [Candidatus Cloacimonetes bacterium]|nr:phenylalanine--tRNA ligase subunit beta [Candidatus Cloacimonadota bacterium]